MENKGFSALLPCVPVFCMLLCTEGYVIFFSTLARSVLLCLHFHLYISFCFNFAREFVVLKRKELIIVLAAISMQTLPLKLHVLVLK